MTTGATARGEGRRGQRSPDSGAQVGQPRAPSASGSAAQRAPLSGALRRHTGAVLLHSADEDSNSDRDGQAQAQVVIPEGAQTCEEVSGRY